MGQMAASDGWDRQAQSFREIRTRRLSGERWAAENRLVVVRDSGSLSEATYSWSPSVGTTQSNFNKKKKKRTRAKLRKKPPKICGEKQEATSSRASTSVPVSSFNHDHSMRRWAHPTRPSTSTSRAEKRTKRGVRGALFLPYCNSQLEGISSDVMIRGWGGHWVNSLVTWSVSWTGYKYSHTCTTHRVRPAIKVRYASGKLKSCEREGQGALLSVVYVVAHRSLSIALFLRSWEFAILFSLRHLVLSVGLRLSPSLR
jgi:hypothetical protein